MTTQTKGHILKKLFLEALQRNFGNISKACEAVGIKRHTYYKWMKQEKFSKEVEGVMDSLVDHAESLLWKQMAEGNTTAVIFFLKCKGKHRGWIERQELFHGGVERAPVRIETKVLRSILGHPEGRKAIEIIDNLTKQDDSGIDQ